MTEPQASAPGPDEPSEPEPVDPQVQEPAETMGDARTVCSPEKIRAEDVKPGDRILPVDGILTEPLDVTRVRIDGGAVMISGAKPWSGWRTDWVWRLYPADGDRQE